MKKLFAILLACVLLLAAASAEPVAYTLIGMMNADGEIVTDTDIAPSTFTVDLEAGTCAYGFGKLVTRGTLETISQDEEVITMKVSLTDGTEAPFVYAIEGDYYVFTDMESGFLMVFAGPNFVTE